MLSLFKKSLLSLYYHGSLPWRAWNNRASAWAGMAPIAVLMYHRVADDRATEWTTSNRMFARQIDWLARHFEIIALGEAQRRMQFGVNRRMAVCITFDDGYADNCLTALPLLVRRRIPCTYFVTTENVLNQTPFAHDLKLGASPRPNTTGQIRALAEAGIEIGGHTRTHADLGALGRRDRLWDEIVLAADELSAIAGRPIRHFAFPFGQHKNLSPLAFALAEEAGFDGVCSAYGGYNLPGDDPFHLQRIAVGEDMLRMKNWVTFDPRKPAITPRYDFRAKQKQASLAESLEPAAAPGE
jgi:peptidoglycan/xylan/chitin deacetylase (PgdA/CDA1 family)